MTSNIPDRRRFLKGAAAGVGAFALGGFTTGIGTAQPSLDLPVTTIIGETGTVQTTQKNPNDWHSVSFKNPLVRLLDLIGGPPVVLMKPPTYRGVQPVHVRLRNVSTSGFEYRLEEWDYEDGSHTTEQVYWTAIAPVTAQIPTVSGLAFNVQTGTVSTDTTGANVDFNLATNFAFESRPIALAQSQTYHGRANSIVTRVDGVEKTGFNVRVQEQESFTNYHEAEDVGYVAMDVPAGGGLIGLDGLDSDLLHLLGLDPVQDALLTEFEARRPTQPIRDSADEANSIPFTKVNGGDGFSKNPRVIADMQTRHGPQPAELRRTNVTRDHFDLFIEEERSKDRETTHDHEDIGFLAVGGNGLIPATILNIDLGALGS